MFTEVPVLPWYVCTQETNPHRLACPTHTCFRCMSSANSGQIASRKLDNHKDTLLTPPAYFGACITCACSNVQTILYSLLQFPPPKQASSPFEPILRKLKPTPLHSPRSPAHSSPSPSTLQHLRPQHPRRTAPCPTSSPRTHHPHPHAPNRRTPRAIPRPPGPAASCLRRAALAAPSWR